MGMFSPADPFKTAGPDRPEAPIPAGPGRGRVPVAQALAMAGRGYRVFPVHAVHPEGTCTCKRAACDNPGKHPCIKGWQKAATADPGRISELWRAWPFANPGVALGPDQVVVDIDGPDGLNQYLGLAGLDTLPDDTLVVRSGSGKPGKAHVYHSLPPGVRVKNGKHGKGGVSPLVEIDIKTDGGYVVAPGGLHKSGQPYRALSWGDKPTPIPPSLLDLLGRKGVSSASSAPCASKPAPKPSSGPRALPGQRKPIVGRANPKQVNRLVRRVIARFPITGQHQRDDQVYRMVGHLLGTGQHPADVQAAGREWLHHFHEQGLIATPLAECHSRLDEQIARTLTRESDGEFTATSEREHVRRALAPGLTCWLDLLPDSLLRNPPSPAPPPRQQAPETQSGLREQETTPGPDHSPSQLRSPAPDPRATGTREPERFRGTRGRWVVTDQERAFLRAVLSWVAYKLTMFPEEGEILLTDGQVRGLLAAWGHPVADEGPTVRRLKAKFFTQEKAAAVFPFLVRTSRGRVVRGKGEPSRYVLSPALAAAILSLPDPGEPAPDWHDNP